MSGDSVEVSRALPSGTYTFMFTDIEGSTELADQNPEAFKLLLARHHEILHQAIEDHGGSVFRIAGDSFGVAFPNALDALDAATAAQLALQAEKWLPEPIRVRMGMHTGIADEAATDDFATGYRGYSTLARTSRVMSLAHGGQVLLSNASAEQVRSDLPEGVELIDLGTHQLKGLAHSEQIWQLAHPDLPHDFPRLKSASTVSSNLPVMLTRFVGRATVLKDISERLAHERLLTLIGPGGTGKTRLAVQAATGVREDFDDRVYFVDLAPARDVDSFVLATAQSIGLRDEGGETLLDAVKGQIGEKKTLLVLDNFEQVTAAGPTAAELLRECPELKQIVTSREALHVSGENVIPVPPLALPDAASGEVSLDQLADCDAVMLFVERARAVKGEFELTDENAAAVAELCARVDGLPLAIELLTARLRLFTPEALVERIGNTMQLLKGGSKDVPERQQTLRAAIDWSYELLDPSEQKLFALLSVFSGATFDSLESVCAVIEGCEDLDVLEGLTSLVEKSLVRQQDASDSELRFTMLATIREFATAKLREDDALLQGALRAHAEFFAGWAGEQWLRLNGEDREDASAAMVADLENLRAAWRHWIAEADLEQLGKLTDSLWLFYEVRGWYHPLRSMASDLLDLLSSKPATPDLLVEQIKLQTSLARILQMIHGLTPEVEEAYQRALELCEEAGEVPQLLPVLRGLSTFYLYKADFERGAEVGKQILELAEEHDDEMARVDGYLVYGANAAFLDQLKVGLEYLDKGIAGYKPGRLGSGPMRLGNDPRIACLITSALLSWILGFPDRALQRCEAALDESEELDHPQSRIYAQFHTGFIHLWRREPERAERRALEVLEQADEFEFPVWSAVGTCLRGAALAALGSAEEGLAMTDQAMKAYQRLKTPPVFWPLLLYLQAGACGLAGRPEDGLTLINDAIEIASEGAGKFLGAEFLRLKGDLLFEQSPENAEDAETWLRTAVDIAEETDALMLQLRATLDLARLCQSSHRSDEARDLIRPVLEKFTEGFETSDLRDARALLDEIG